MNIEFTVPENYNDVVFEIEIISLKTINEPNVNTVKEVEYRLLGSDGTLAAEHLRALILDTENIENFTNYAELTKEAVKAWIETLSNYQIDKYSICNVILDAKKEASKQSLPWE
jgi:hypothetical protein